jgi:type II secretion system protein G
MTKNNKGFTLIELLVVIAIIGLLSTMAVVSLNTARGKSRDARRMSDIKQIQTALEMYNGDNGTYFTTATATLASGALGTPLANYMAIPDDPGSNTYLYASDEDTYTLTFVLEQAAAGFTAGTVTASETGLSQ